MNDMRKTLTIPQLVSALRDDGFSPEWGELVLIASQTATEEHFQSLAELLRFEDPAVRQGVAAIMARLSSPYVVKLLLEQALEVQDDQIVKIAITALMQVRESAVQLLQEVMEKSYGIAHIKAALILVEIGNAVGVETLLEAIDSSDGGDIEEILPGILEALGNLREARAVLPLLNFLVSDNWLLRLVAAKSLVKIGESAVEGLLDVAKNSRDLDARCRAVEALGRIGSISAVAPLVQLLNSSESPMQNEIIDTLGRIGAPAALEALIQILETGPSSMYFRASKSLVKIGQPAASPLMRVLRQHPNPDARRCVVTALGQIGDAEAVPTIIHALQDDNSLVRKAATDALGQLKDDQAVIALCGVLERENWFVVRGAADALAKIGDERAVGPLLRALKDDRSEVRQQIVKALHSFRPTLNAWLAVSDTNEHGNEDEMPDDPTHRQVVVLLADALSDNDPMVRINVARLLVSLQGESVVRTIEAILARNGQGASEIREALHHNAAMP